MKIKLLRKLTDGIKKGVKNKINNIKNLPRKIKELPSKASAKTWQYKLNPQEAAKQDIKSGIIATAEHPIGVVGTVAGNLSTPVGAVLTATGNPLGPKLMKAPITEVSLGFENIGRKLIPAYDKGTKKLGQKLRNSKGFDSSIGAIVGKEPAVNFQNSGPRASLRNRVGYNIRSGIADISNGVQAGVKTINNYLKGFSDVEEVENGKDWILDRKIHNTKHSKGHRTEFIMKKPGMEMQSSSSSYTYRS